MIKKSIFEEDLIAGMQQQLTANEKSTAINNLDIAVESLHSAVEILEEAGMKNHADAILNILLKFAKQPGPHGKKDPHTSGLTSEKMIQNLLHHGTEFNMSDDGGINDLLEADVDGESINTVDLDFDFEDEI